MKPQLRYKPGDRIGGHYQVHKALMGGMGEVYLCLDLKGVIPLALKTFQQRYTADAKFLSHTFEHEVATWVALEKHPNIVRCFGMEIIDKLPFMRLEWIIGDKDRGADLRSWLRHGPLNEKLALEIIIDICRGLIHAQSKHQGGAFVHCDLKPENILIAQGGIAKITDFGLAEIVRKIRLETDIVDISSSEPESLISSLPGIIGTPTYMSPEQWRREVLDERADIYAIGCILYEILVGKAPYQVTSMPNTPQSLQMWLKALQQEHEQGRLPALPESLSPVFGTLLQCCLEKSKVERPTSMKDLYSWLIDIYRSEFDQFPPVRSEPGVFTSYDYCERGATYYDLGRYDQALKDLNIAIELQPKLASAFTNRGNTYSALGKHELALIDFEKASELAPDLAMNYINWGATLAKLRLHRKALSSYNQAVKLAPHSALAYSNRGASYTDLELYEKALADYEYATRLDPNLALIYNNRGLCYSALKRYQKSIVEYNRAIELDPDFTEAYSNRGNAYYHLEKYENALADFDHVVKRSLNSAMAYYNRGVAYRALDQIEQALSDYSHAIELDSKFAPAYYNRGVIQQSLEQYELAIADYLRAIEANPSDLQPYYNLGTLLAKLDRFQAALPFLEKAEQLGDPRGARAATQVRHSLGVQMFDAFWQADSEKAMEEVALCFPLLTQIDFTIALEQMIAHQIKEEDRPAFEQRLAWLRQITKEQNQ